MNNTFGKPIIPENEEARLERLHSYHILETHDNTRTFRHVTAMAIQIFKVPIALVSLVGYDKVFFKANIGMEGVKDAKRGESLCSLTILSDEVTVFEKAKEDPCLLANPLVTGSFGLQFYAGAPLITPDGYNIGAVCVVDKTPRKFSEADRALLESLAAVVMDELETEKLVRLY